MKALTYTFCILGTLLMLFFMSYMFIPRYDGIISNDKALLSLLMGALMFSFVGFWFDTYNSQAYSRHRQKIRREQLRSTAAGAIICLLVIIAMILF